MTAGDPAEAVGRHVERELKYRLRDADHAGRYAATKALASLRASGRARQVQIEDRYLDTSDRALARAGYAARLRHGPTMTILSVKAAGPAGSALHRRDELEGPADLSLDPHAWPSSAARSLVLEHAGDAPLREIVTIRQLRRTRVLADGAAEVELSVDDVEVVHEGRVIERFLELEVELRRGDESVLEAVAGELGSDPDLAPVTTSKLDRALAVVGVSSGRGGRRPSQADGPVAADPAPDPPGAQGPAAKHVRSAGNPKRASEGEAAEVSVRAPSVADQPAPTPDSPAPAPAEPVPDSVPKLIVGRTPGVTHEDLLAEAGRKVLRFHLARMLAKEAGTRSGAQIEDLHGMRVATRRMRAAWRVFDDGFKGARTLRIRRRLREVATRLGTVRDLDVLIEALEAHRAAVDPAQAAGLGPLVAAWTDQREAARVLLVRELDSPGYARFVDEYRVFVSTEGAAAIAPASPVTPHRVRDTAGSRIWLAYEQVRAYEAVLRWADVETLHNLRIAGKWLRYTLEFFREALGPEVDVLIARVTALQDHLGLLNDADVTIGLTRQFLLANAGSLTLTEVEAIGDYLRIKERELERLRRAVGGPWRAISGAQFRRLLGRAVSAL